MKRIIWTLLIPWVALVAWPSLGWSAEELATMPVERITVPRVYRLDGVVEASNRSTVSAQTSGRVKEVFFDVDDLVEQGDVILLIEETEQRANLASAEANLAAAEAQRDEAEKEYRRIRRVYEKDVVPKSTFDKAASARDSAKAAVDAAKASLEQAQQQLSYTRVTAPYTGIVTERFIEVGEVASRGQSLMSGISLQQLRVEVDVPASMIAAVRKRQLAMVEIGGQWVAATAMTIFPVAGRATDSFRVRLDLPEGIEDVYPGMYLEVALEVGQRSALVVPRTSVVFRSEVIGVYILDEQDRIQLRHVRVGDPLPDQRFTVLSGVDVGERVALNPHLAVLALKQQRSERHADE